MIRSLLFLALLAGVAGQSCASNNDCSLQGECLNSLCACASGAYGAQCASLASPSCVYANLSNLATDNFPILDTANSDVQNDNLHVVVFSPLVNNRLATSLFFGDINAPNAHPDCAFPGQYWVKSIDANCQEVYTADIPWALAAQCGWSTDSVSQPGFVIWKNHIYVRHDDQLSVFRGVPVKRDTIHTFPIQIRFQTTVEVDTSINIFAPVNLLAAVTVQTYDPSASQGDVSILTSLQWPFYLVSVSGNFPASISATVAGSDIDCQNVANAACTQLYTITIDPLQACSLSGSYELTFVLGCRGDPAACPLDANTNSAVVTASINSENFCNGVELDVSLTGILEVFQEAAYTNLKSNFLYDQSAFFRATLTTDGSVSVVSSIIEQVRLTDGVVTRFLLDIIGNNPPSVTANGGLVSFAVAAGNPVLQPGFSFIPNDQVTPAPVDSQQQYTIYARIRVGYTGGVQRRSIIARQAATSSSTAGDYNVAIVTQNPASSSTSVTSDSSISTETVDLGSAASLAATALVLAL